MSSSFVGPLLTGYDQDATEKPKGFGGIGVVFELRQTILRQKSITKTREKSGEIYEDSKEYLPVVDQILPDSPARKIGKVHTGCSDWQEPSVDFDA